MGFQRVPLTQTHGLEAHATRCHGVWRQSGRTRVWHVVLTLSSVKARHEVRIRRGIPRRCGIATWRHDDARWTELLTRLFAE